jgi:adenine-specific DNA-methyltransferase
LFGKVKRRVDSSDTKSAPIFEEFRKGKNGHFLAVETIENLLQSVKAKYIILSYSSGGRATAEDLLETLNRCGTLLETIEIDYKTNVMANMKWTNEWIRDVSKPNREFLFLLKK